MPDTTLPTEPIADRFGFHPTVRCKCGGDLVYYDLTSPGGNSYRVYEMQCFDCIRREAQNETAESFPA